MKKPTMWAKRVAVFACAAALCLGAGGALAGCSSQQEQEQPAQEQEATEGASAETRTFVDSVGREVEIPVEVERVAPSGFVAQQVLLPIAGDKLVGLGEEITEDQQRFLGSEYADLPIFGAAFGASDTLNKEALAAEDPQMIIDVGEAKDGLAEDLDALQEQLGIPCVFVSATLDTYDETYATLGELLGEEERGTELSDYCARVYEETETALASIPEDQRVRAMYVTGDAGQNVLAKDSYQSQVIDMCADNVAVVDEPSGKGTGNEVSLEQIALWDPDLIIFQTGSIYDTVGDDPAWANISAIASGNYYEVPDLPYTWMNNPPSVNQMLGMQWFPRLCYPDAFETSMQEAVTDYFRMFYGHDLTQEEYDELTAHAQPKE